MYDSLLMGSVPFRHFEKTMLIDTFIFRGVMTTPVFYICKPDPSSLCEIYTHLGGINLVCGKFDQPLWMINTFTNSASSS